MKKTQTCYRGTARYEREKSNRPEFRLTEGFEAAVKAEAGSGRENNCQNSGYPYNEMKFDICTTLSFKKFTTPKSQLKITASPRKQKQLDLGTVHTICQPYYNSDGWDFRIS